MAKGFKTGGGGGGAALNFKVVAYATNEERQAATPGENTIGVITTQAITRWAFASNVPQNPIDGMLHFTTASAAAGEFNALKKNDIHVYPTGCTQYSGGAWVSRDSAIFKDGEWKDWSLLLYKDGVFYDASLTASGQCSFTANSDHVYISSVAGGTGNVVFDKKYDLTPYKTISITGNTNVRESNGIGFINIGAMSMLSAVPEAALSGVYTEGTYTLDISNLSGEYYIGVYIQGFSDYVNFTLREFRLR